MVAPAVPEYVLLCPFTWPASKPPKGQWIYDYTPFFWHSCGWWLTRVWCRIYEEEDNIYAAVDARTETLQNLRELGPPDLVYLVKQPKANANRQVS